jgi:UDP-2,3-diacylglucosamine hydrolase
MRLAFISDLHLSRDRPDIQARFEDFVRRQSHRYDVLYILGDLFEFWLGDDCADLIGHGATEDLLRELCAGRPVYVMHGNRDFLLGREFCRRTGCTLIEEPCTISLGGRDVLLVHGDSLCTGDADHQRYRSMVRDRVWQQRFLGLTPEQRLATALDMRERSEAGKKDKPPDIMDVSGDAVTAAMERAGVRLLIHGHTHRPAIHRWTRQGHAHARIVLGDWFDQSSVLEADDADRLRLGPDLGEIDLGELDPIAGQARSG